MTKEKAAYDRGDSDAYYGRCPHPHYWLDMLGQETVEKEHMTPKEINAYWKGYNENPSDRKLWE